VSSSNSDKPSGDNSLAAVNANDQGILGSFLSRCRHTSDDAGSAWTGEASGKTDD